jgi:hypothetical protein
MLLSETILVILAVLLAIIRPTIGAHSFEGIERAFSRLANRRSLAVAVVGITALALRAALLPIEPIPRPALNDEFSYLLMADTFAHGRLTNPTHPMWQHLEAIFVIHRPTYCSMYYPAQGMFMALGKIFAGNAFWGVWLSCGLMCAAICWMLQGWVAPLWALMGGLLAVMRIASLSYWDNSYWGGAVTALGGALVLGALPRLKRRRRIIDAWLMGVGFALLISSRPYETFFFAIPVFGSLLIWVIRRRRLSDRATLHTAIVPLVGLLIATTSFMMYYCWRTTGSPFQPPYLVNLRTYAVDPNFAWLPLRPVPEYYNADIRARWLGWDLDQYNVVRQHPLFSVFSKGLMLWLFYFGPLITLPFVALSFALPYGTSWNDMGRQTRYLIYVCSSVMLGIALAVPIEPHYFAPALAAAYGLIVIAMQRLRQWSDAGIFLVRAVPTIAVALLAIHVVGLVFHLSIKDPRALTWETRLPTFARTQVEDQLSRIPGKHLVIVHYERSHNPEQSWVTNDADINNSKIVWAHDMGAQRNAELIYYFQSRSAWMAYPDDNPVRLSPFK